ncbi:hypothetical protein [Schinkia azotoformans]|uniref:hypothetical protein n=1 Tax=Schinkia azotoformans TaxID=1454 RepID=UPI002DBA38CF|nr:hypothetical protein [Schinkia azotoformans]MEC1697763.1 hypothetical protein [Schinkia azotoformans]
MNRLHYASNPEIYRDAKRELHTLDQNKKRYCNECMSIIYSEKCHVCGSLDTKEIEINLEK